MLLCVKCKQIKKFELVCCWLDIVNDLFEISLDENVIWILMYFVDQFEWFCEFVDGKGWGVEEIGVWFGVLVGVVK